MVTELYKNVYSFPVVLPDSPLKAINIYVIKDKEKALVLDTGYNMEESKESMIQGLKELGLKVEDTSLFLTHLHSDHTGLAAMFADAGCDVYASKLDGESVNNMAKGKYWNLMGELLQLFGISEDEINVTDNPGYLYRLSHAIDIKYVEPGDIIKTGDYEFEVADLKGHTPGHIGLIEKNHKLLFCGDTILNRITPNITFWGFEYGDILGTYISTLLRLRGEDIEHCFSTHRSMITDYRKRIDELVAHHIDRLQEILDAMEEGEEYVIREISPRISWRIKADSWDDFPAAQKFFASGETMSHVEHLVFTGNVKRENRNGTLYFKKVNPKYEKEWF
ncbi:MBL fold metallo-hydrolase [Peptostreptococcus faecalis]|uniref:MBL fold metallo-hydrolase n=1 Tax=Peptostreptococcus faecalis TaxID=2045015 RepID=UPI000C7A4290|nr:MBL fold metallo-hydrolase [Peptostreptococcus faecalis]